MLLEEKQVLFWLDPLADSTRLQVKMFPKMPFKLWTLILIVSVITFHTRAVPVSAQLSLDNPDSMGNLDQQIDGAVSDIMGTGTDALGPAPEAIGDVNNEDEVDYDDRRRRFTDDYEYEEDDDDDEDDFDDDDDEDDDDDDDDDDVPLKRKRREAPAVAGPGNTTSGNCNGKSTRSVEGRCFILR